MKTYPDLPSMVLALFPTTKSVTYHDATGSGLSGVSSTPSLATVFLENGETVELFLKVCKKGSYPYSNNTMAKTMEKEIMFYEDILPKMIAFESLRGLNEIWINRFMPKYYGGGVTQEGDIVVILENIQKLGFKAVGAREFLSVDQIKVSLEAIAAFHAVSYGMKVIDGFDWLSVPNLVDFIHSKENEDVYSVYHLDMNKHYLRLLQLFIDEKDSNDIIKKNLSRFCSREFLSELQQLQPKIFEILRHCRSPVEPQGLLCHGDYHMWNVAFDEHQSGLKMFDFQIICYASGLTDLHYFLSQSTTPAVRKNEKEAFLRLYSDTFLKLGRTMGIPEEKLELFTEENVKKEYRNRSAFLYLFGLHYFTIRLIKDREKFGKTKGMTDNLEIINTVNECGPRTWEIFQHVFDLINKIQDLGTIDVMKETIAQWQEKAE